MHHVNAVRAVLDWVIDNHPTWTALIDKLRDLIEHLVDLLD
jgi:hypothetical protein